MKNLTNVNTIVTHAATFHSDEVFGTAFMQTLIPGVEVVRTINRQEVAEYLQREDSLVFDIGLGEYDHHQSDKALREDGTPYCAFGLLWRDYGHLLCPTESAWAKVDRDLVLAIDKADNGIEGNTLSTTIAQLNPSWDENPDTTPGFWKAVAMATEILNAYIRRANSAAKAAELVRQSPIDDGVLVLNQYLPWQEVVITSMPEVMFVVFPSNRGGYNIQTVPVEEGSFTGRKGFPTEWLGHPDASLGMTFCHPGNFLASTQTLEQAINVAKIAIAK